jgi:hypothetical protein
MTEPPFPYKPAPEVTTGMLPIVVPRPVGTIPIDQNGKPVSWIEFCRRVIATVKRHERMVNHEHE